MSSLTPTARVILGMLKLGLGTGYDIKKVIDFSTRFFWTASYGQIYPELKRLRKAGLVRAEQVPRGKVKRNVYSLTPKGEQALHDWLTDSEDVLFEIRDENLLRLFFSDMLSRDEVIANLRTQEQLFEQVLRRFRELEVDAREGVGEGRVYPYLALQYGIEFIAFARDWYGERARRLEAGEELVQLEDDEAAGGEGRLGPAG
ncbi:MAG TPA: PadR family transcriptional regulator [Gaiellaceae bacterium]|nr:PadR family transcriptional regulator [Gaiellaceae bacterium]